MTADSSPYAAANVDLVWQSDRPFIFLQNDNGQTFAWATNGSAVIGGGSPGDPGPSWHAKASGDFNGDGSPDILWQNDSGEVVIWEMNGATVIANTSLGNPARAGTPGAPATSTATASRTSCGRTTVAKS